MQIMYVETCPDCECVVVRAPTGESKPSRLMAGCTGCSCHKSWQKTQSLQKAQSQHGVPEQGHAEDSEQFTQIASGS
jgi:hypothetical protein